MLGLPCCFSFCVFHCSSSIQFFFFFPSFHPRVAPHQSHHPHSISSRLRFLCADEADTRPVQPIQPRHAITRPLYHAVDQTSSAFGLTDLDWSGETPSALMTTSSSVSVHHLIHQHRHSSRNRWRQLDTDQRTTQLQDTPAIFVSRPSPAPQHSPSGFGFAADLFKNRPVPSSLICSGQPIAQEWPTRRRSTHPTAAGYWFISAASTYTIELSLISCFQLTWRARSESRADCPFSLASLLDWFWLFVQRADRILLVQLEFIFSMSWSVPDRWHTYGPSPIRRYRPVQEPLDTADITLVLGPATNLLVLDLSSRPRMDKCYHLELQSRIWSWAMGDWPFHKSIDDSLPGLLLQLACRAV